MYPQGLLLHKCIQLKDGYKLKTEVSLGIPLLSKAVRSSPACSGIYHLCFTPMFHFPGSRRPTDSHYQKSIFVNDEFLGWTAICLGLSECVQSGLKDVGR